MNAVFNEIPGSDGGRAQCRRTHRRRTAGQRPARGGRPHRARRLQEDAGGSLLGLLARLGLQSERDHAETAAAVLGLPLASVKDAPACRPKAWR